MTKLTLTELADPDDVTTLNDNFKKISDFIQSEVLTRVNRSGEPNAMKTDLDMNSNDILNGRRISAQEFVLLSGSPLGYLYELQVTDHQGNIYKTAEVYLDAPLQAYEDQNGKLHLKVSEDANINDLAIRVRNLETTTGDHTTAIGDINNRISSIQTPDTIELSGDDRNQTLTATIKHGGSSGTVISQSSASLRGMIGHTPGDGQSYTVFYGWSADTTVDADEAKAGTKKLAGHIHGLDIHYVRVDTDQKYLFAWIPDTFGEVEGFYRDGFIDTWASSALDVDGVAGKVYISDNPTATLDVTYEIVKKGSKP